MNIEAIARTAHEANRSYCLSLGDTSQPAWGDAPDWQKQSAIEGVRYHQKNPDAGPSGSHYSWMAQKVRDGWQYGPEKDAEKKTHPCMVPYEELPQAQKAKDYVFLGVVHALLPLLEPEDAGDYGMIYLADGEMPGTMRMVVKYNDGNTFNKASHAHQHISLLCGHMADIAQKLDEATLQPVEKELHPVSEATH